MEILALTLDIIGKVMVAYTALAVHHRVRNEHKIDSAVFKIMKREMVVGVLGIALMIVGYVAHLLINI
jgi:uncharacterized membrane protein YidH (DUF202 family)